MFFRHHHKTLFLFVGFIFTTLALSACLAPEDLDYTPTAPPPTETPIPQPTDAASAGDETNQESPGESRAALDNILETLPSTISASVIVWQSDNVEPQYVEREGGVTGRVNYDERGGGHSELTFGVFDTPEAARAYYDEVRGQLRTLERAQERDNFVKPNAFGGGTYGSDAIFVIDNIFIRISVPRFSSTAGDPLVPYAREVFRILQEGGIIQLEES